MKATLAAGLIGVVAGLLLMGCSDGVIVAPGVARPGQWSGLVSWSAGGAAVGVLTIRIDAQGNVTGGELITATEQRQVTGGHHSNQPHSFLVELEGGGRLGSSTFQTSSNEILGTGVYTPDATTRAESVNFTLSYRGS